jgi:Ca2+-binding EF-hand superfamily protein
MFDKFDKDGGGEMDHAEVVIMLRSLGFSVADIETIYDGLDEDHDGTVTRNEFIHYMAMRREMVANDDPEEMAKKVRKWGDGWMENGPGQGRWKGRMEREDGWMRRSGVVPLVGGWWGC